MGKLMTTYGALERSNTRLVNLFAKTCGKDLVGTELDEALEWCRIYAANPFVKDIYFFPMGKFGTDKRKVVPVLSIGMYRKIAARSGNYRPDPAPPRFTYDERLVGPANPKGIVDCEVSVYRHSHGEWFPITSRIKWDERAPLIEDCPAGYKLEDTGETWPDGNPKKKKVPKGPVVRVLDPKKENWHKMGETMLAKCFCEETEILTANGFRRFKDVGDSPIMQVTDHGLEPVVARPFFQPYDGEMVTYIGDKALNFMVTPNHDMVTTGGKMEALELYEAARARPLYFIPRISAGRSIDAQVSDDAIRLAAAILCDGWFDSALTVTLAVSKDYKIERLRGYGLAKKEWVRPSAGDSARLKTGRVITTLRDKTYLSFDASLLDGLVIGGRGSKRPDVDLFTQLSLRQAKIFIEEMIFFDGSIDKKTGVCRFTQNDGPIADLFELMACAAGYCVSTATYPGRTGRIMTISDRDAVPVVRWNRQHGRERDGSGKVRLGLRKEKNPGTGVWCVTVPSGKIIVRRKSFSMVCGNCTEVDAIRKGWPNETAGSYEEAELDAVNAIDLTATEIVQAEERQERLSKIGGINTILVDWCDGSELQPVPVGKFFDQAMAFIKAHTKPKEEEYGAIKAWRARNRQGLLQFWGMEKDAALELRKQLDAIEKKAETPPVE